MRNEFKQDIERIEIDYLAELDGNLPDDIE